MISRIMKYKKHVFLFLLLLTCRVYAQDVHLKLYEQQEPKTDKIDSSGYIREVFSPELLGYLPENRTGLNHAVLLIPGGAYSYIAISHEGYGSAKWLAKNGITVFILKYRLPKGDPQVTSGESGAVTFGVLNEIMTNPEYADLKEALQLDENSQVLLFSTEGDTDPERYKEIVWDGKDYLDE